MTRAQREVLVERYLAGEMAASEEQEFFMNVATDSELFGTLRAHRMVDRALTRDRDMLPSGYVSVQDRALALLAAQPVVETTTTTVANWLSRSRFGTWGAIFSTAVVFSMAGFAARGLVDAPSRDITQAISPATVVQQPSTVEPSPSTPSHAIPSPSDQTQPVTPDVGGSETAHAARIAEPVAPDPVRSEDRRLQTRNLDSSSNNETARHDSSLLTRKTVRAEHQRRSDTVQAPTVQSEEPAALERVGRDSIPFRIRTNLPQLKTP